jgi:hypothetical protein
MSSINTLTGRNGELAIGTAGSNPATRILRITSWAVNPTLATTSEWGDSDCAGYTARAAGRYDATFTAEGKYDSTDEVWDRFQPGIIGDDTTVTIASATLHLTGTAGDHWFFPRALCTDFNLTVDVDTEEVIGWTSSWGADGVFYFPGQSQVTGQAANITIAPP